MRLAGFQSPPTFLSLAVFPQSLAVLSPKTTVARLLTSGLPGGLMQPRSKTPADRSNSQPSNGSTNPGWTPTVTDSPENENPVIGFVSQPTLQPCRPPGITRPPDPPRPLLPKTPNPAFGFVFRHPGKRHPLSGTAFAGRHLSVPVAAQVYPPIERFDSSPYHAATRGAFDAMPEAS
jgi:hypothetical protein